VYDNIINIYKSLQLLLSILVVYWMDVSAGGHGSTCSLGWPRCGPTAPPGVWRLRR